MNKFLVLLEMIKFEHTIFALPFALLGAFLAAQGLPGARTMIWITLAMVGARSAAMAFNRQVDRVYDGLNPRTANRALPRGLVNPGFVALFILASSALFLLSSWMLNDLAFYLSPLALAVVFLYSLYKKVHRIVAPASGIVTRYGSTGRLDRGTRAVRCRSPVDGSGSSLLGGRIRHYLCLFGLSIRPSGWAALSAGSARNQDILKNIGRVPPLHDSVTRVRVFSL